MDVNIALLAGDGIGPEIIAEATKVLDRVAAKFGHRFDYREALVGACAIDATGDPYPDDDVTWSGFFCRRVLQAELPEKTGMTTQVDQVQLTTRSVTFFLTPDDEAYGFTAGVLDEESYKKYASMLGEEQMQYFTAYSMRFYTSAEEVSYMGLEAVSYTHLTLPTKLEV